MRLRCPRFLGSLDKLNFCHLEKSLEEDNTTLLAFKSDIFLNSRSKAKMMKVGLIEKSQPLERHI